MDPDSLAAGLNVNDPAVWFVPEPISNELAEKSICPNLTESLEVATSAPST